MSTGSIRQYGRTYRHRDILTDLLFVARTGVSGNTSGFTGAGGAVLTGALRTIFALKEALRDSRRARPDLGKVCMVKLQIAQMVKPTE